MRIAFSDLATGRAVNPPRLRYSSPTPDAERRYFANIHAGAVTSYEAACVRAGSHFMTVDATSADRRTLHNPDPVNWTIIILYSLKNGEPLAFMHETHLSGFRVGATTGLAVQQSAREDAEILGLFGTGNQAFPNCRAICAVRPIKKVKVFSPSAAHREGFRERMKNEPVEVILVDDPREVASGLGHFYLTTNSGEVYAVGKPVSGSPCSSPGSACSVPG